MKKLLIISNIITLSVVMLLSYTGCHHPAPPCTTSCFPPDNTQPFTPLDGQYIQMLVRNYWMKQWTSYRQHSPNALADARSVYFSLATVKRFIHMIEDSACKSCWLPKPELGLRIYYGTYPDSAEWIEREMHGLSHTYEGHHTVLMVPAYFDPSTGNNVDFDPGHIEGGPACKPMTISQIFALPKPTMRVLVGGDNGNIPAGMQNMGNLWPPPYPSVQPDCNGAQLGILVDPSACP